MLTPSSILLHLIKHRLFSLNSWRFKLFAIVAAALFYIGLYQSRYLFPRTVDPGWNGVANKTAFLDRRCDRAIQKICRDKGALNCSGIQPSLPPNNIGLWEVKLQLFNSPRENPNWPDMVVYGVKDSICAEMAFE